MKAADEASSSMSLSNNTRFIIVLCTSVLNSAVALSINASKINGKIPYDSVSVTFLVEVVKMISCISTLFYLRYFYNPKTSYFSIQRSGSSSLESSSSHHLHSASSSSSCPSFYESILFSIPAFLYMLDNNIVFVIINYIDPATLAVVWNLKIITTALMFRFILKRRVSHLQWISILLLLCGILTNEGAHTSNVVHNNNNNNSTTVEESEAKASSGFVFGMILVVIGVTISSMAGVYTEWVFKRRPNLSFFIQNFHFYLYGILFNAMALLIAQINAKTLFFEGFNAWTWVIILLQTVTGVSIGFLLKFLDNIAVVFSHGLAMVFTTLASIWFFGFKPSLEFFCGAVVTCVAMYLYHLDPLTLVEASATSSTGRFSDVTSSAGRNSTSSFPFEYKTSPSVDAGDNSSVVVSIEGDSQLPTRHRRTSIDAATIDDSITEHTQFVA